MIVWDKLKVTNSTNSITISPENNKIICGTAPLYLRQSNDQLLSLNAGTITASDIITETITAVGGRILLDKETGVNGNTNIYAGKIQISGGSNSSATAILTSDDLSISTINSDSINTQQLSVRGTTRSATLSPTTLGVQEIYADQLAAITIGAAAHQVTDAYIYKLHTDYIATYQYYYKNLKYLQENDWNESKLVDADPNEKMQVWRIQTGNIVDIYIDFKVNGNHTDAWWCFKDTSLIPSGYTFIWAAAIGATGTPGGGPVSLDRENTQWVADYRSNYFLVGLTKNTGGLIYPEAMVRAHFRFVKAS